jgi:glycosyltransferase involved in cell wall biosynthesis
MKRDLTRYWGSHFKSARHAANLAIEFQVLASRGWNCNLVLEHLPEDSLWLDQFKQLGVTLSTLPRPRSQFDISHAQAIRRLCLQTNCNVFLCENMHMSPLIGATAAAVPVKLWYKHSMNSCYEEARAPGIREKISISTRLSAKLSSRVVAVSSSVRNELLELGIPHHKVVVLNNPRPEIKSNLPCREQARAFLDIPGDALVVAALGRAESVKGWDILLKAFQPVKARNPQVLLVLAGSCSSRGDSSFKQELDKIIEQNNISSSVRFTGHLSDSSLLLRAADLFVLPSRSEGCCLSLLEALEAGLPCIASRVGNAAEVLTTSKAGILIDRGDQHQLKEALRLLIENEQKRKAMANQARVPEHIPDRLTHANQLADLYEDLIRENQSSKV